MSHLARNTAHSWFEVVWAHISHYFGSRNVWVFHVWESVCSVLHLLGRRHFSCVLPLTLSKQTWDWVNCSPLCCPVVICMPRALHDCLGCATPDITVCALREKRRRVFFAISLYHLSISLVVIGKPDSSSLAITGPQAIVTASIEYLQCTSASGTDQFCSLQALLLNQRHLLQLQAKTSTNKDWCLLHCLMDWVIWILSLPGVSC